MDAVELSNRGLNTLIERKKTVEEVGRFLCLFGNFVFLEESSSIVRLDVKNMERTVIVSYMGICVYVCDDKLVFDHGYIDMKTGKMCTVPTSGLIGMPGVIQHRNSLIRHNENGTYLIGHLLEKQYYFDHAPLRIKGNLACSNSGHVFDLETGHRVCFSESFGNIIHVDFDERSVTIESESGISTMAREKVGLSGHRCEKEIDIVYIYVPKEDRGRFIRSYNEDIPECIGNIIFDYYIN